MYFHCAYLAPHEYDNVNQNYDLVWQLDEGGDRRRNHRWNLSNHPRGE